jgi:DNA polymerase/3'-5' exonuclease PolX
MDNKQKILNALDVLRIRDLSTKDKFSAIAYAKAIKELKKLDSINSLSDVEGIPGVGKKIKEKIQEILTTGSLEAATIAKSELKIDVYQDLLKVHGIGPTKAKELIDKHKIRSIADLRSKQELINDVQKMGLKYYEDSLERIPREEMEEHEKRIKAVIPDSMIVGSYRRGAETSGDIDVLIKAKDSFKNIVTSLKEQKYIVDILGLGLKKCMAFVKLNSDSKARRLDLLMTPEKEYAYAQLYFTGSDTFNVAFRKYALTKGYTLNEHGMKPIREAADVPFLGSEKDIFKFLNLKYKEPIERINEDSVVEKKKK